MPDGGGFDAADIATLRQALAGATQTAGLRLSYPTSLNAALGRFLRRTGGLTVRVRGGREYVVVPNAWLDDLDAAYQIALADEAAHVKQRDGA